MAETWTGQRLREYREGCPRSRKPKGPGCWGPGLTRAEFAQIIGVNERTISRWELGETPIPATVKHLLERLVRAGVKRPKSL